MDHNRFDRLTRVFVNGTSRRALLRGALASGLGLLAVGGIDATEARNRGGKGKGKGQNGTGGKGGNSACAHFCHALLSGSAAGHCTADAAHGTGLCTECGPAAPGGGVDPSSLRCGSGEAIDASTCTCVSTICSAGGDACSDTAGRECGTDQSGTACFCASAADDVGDCFLGDPNNCARATCDPADALVNHGCATDERCVIALCCGAAGVCIPRCQPGSTTGARHRR